MAALLRGKSWREAARVASRARRGEMRYALLSDNCEVSAAVRFPGPVLVADVGGTHARFALVGPSGAPGPVARLRTGDHDGFVAAVRSLGWEAPQSVVCCGAGPVEGRRLRLTNAPWTIDGPAIAAELGLAQGLALNDFEAQALALPALRPEWSAPIGDAGAAQTQGTRLILGPGTGLGVGALLETAGGWMAQPSEACHAGLGPEGDEETAIWSRLERAHGRITSEAVLSGRGLERLHAARLPAEGAPAQRQDAARIVAAALADPAGPEAATARLFWRILGRFAGDMALVFLAAGGVTIAGGVAQRLAPLLDPAAFRRAFAAKAPLAGFVGRIATRLVVADDTVLAGMAAIAERPQAYAIDYVRRRWR